MSNVLRLRKTVRRITVLQPNGQGMLEAVTVFRGKKGKKKGSDLFKPLERGTRRIADSLAKTSTRYVERHNKSNRKKKDGWIRDLATNSVKSMNSGVKKLKLSRFVIG